MSAPVIYPLHVGDGERDKATFVMGARPQPITIPFIMFYIRAGERHILVDTGVGAPEATAAHHHPMSQTAEQAPVRALARLGIRPEDIDTVINSHLHWDHCYNNHLFPNATIYAQRAELQYALAPLPVHLWAYDSDQLTGPSPVLPQFLKARLTLIEGDFEVAPGVSIWLTPGHTPGLQSVIVQGARGRYVIASDNIPLLDNLPGRHKPYFTPNGIHVDLLAYYRSFERIAATGGEILPSHDFRVLDRERYE